MSEQNAQEKEFAIQRLYLKDLSFESPMGPEVFKEAWKPRIHLDVNTKNTQLEAGFFEVVLCLTVTAKTETEEETGFLVEVHQAGIFACKGLEGAELQHVLNTIAPNILFPYAREVIDSTVTKASFPPLMLAPINFDALYKQAMEQQEQQPTH